MVNHDSARVNHDDSASCRYTKWPSRVLKIYCVLQRLSVAGCFSADESPPISNEVKAVNTIDGCIHTYWEVIIACEYEDTYRFPSVSYNIYIYVYIQGMCILFTYLGDLLYTLGISSAFSFGEYYRLYRWYGRMSSSQYVQPSVLAKARRTGNG